jgi:hypothetical protein
LCALRHEYADGTRCQIVGLCFAAEPIDGELQLSDETIAFGYFSLPEIESMDIMEPHLERIRDALAARKETFIR